MCEYKAYMVRVIVTRKGSVEYHTLTPLILKMCERKDYIAKRVIARDECMAYNYNEIAIARGLHMMSNMTES